MVILNFDFGLWNYVIGKSICTAGYATIINL